MAVLEALDRTEAPAQPPSRPSRTATGKPKTGPGLKHIGGYFDKEDVATFALLKAWLELDNSELIKRAIDDLYAKEQARRSFGG
ncbi:MAG: hypothetical protein DI526_01185 [Caulobacter segnis]|uniref:Uncharacterized protein n=2 Tax=Caulobacter segnis TaxID=88688 RepID=A0A2W5WSM8_9CAUL|nr:MAG: hypothetical protein DI526_01185 [Caulobacter segnis]